MSHVVLLKAQARPFGVGNINFQHRKFTVKKSIATVLVMASMTTANVANAEFVLGLQGGVSNSEGQVARDVPNGNEVLGSRTTLTHSNGSDTSLGIFGQYRHTLSNAWFLGAHLGYAKDSGEWGREYAFLERNEDGSIFEETGVRKYAADYTYDILAVVGYKGEKVNPFVMFGYSAMQVKGSISDRRVNTVNRDHDFSAKDNKTLNGWKLALGVEVPFSNALVGHALFHFAEYDGGDFFDGNDGNNGDHDTRNLDVSQQGIRFGIGYTF